MKERNQIYIVKCIYQFFLNGFIIKKMFFKPELAYRKILFSEMLTRKKIHMKTCLFRYHALQNEHCLYASGSNFSTQ